MRQVRFGIQLWSPYPVSKVVDQVRLAEQLGFDSAWLIDSQLIAPDLYVKLTACALNTKRIVLGVGVTNTITRHPTVTAGALASLADLIPGRIAAAVSVGGSSVKSIGLPAARLAQFRRDFELIARLLRGDRSIYNGREIKLVWADPETTKHVRLSVQAHGPNGQELAGEMGYPVGFSSELQRLNQCIEQVKIGMTKAGRNVQDLKVRWSIPTSLAEDWEAIKEHRLTRVATLVRERYSRYQQGSLRAEELPVDLEVAQRISRGYQYLEHASTGASHAQELLSYPDEQWRKWLRGNLIGTTEEVLPVLRDGLSHACIEEVVLDLHVSTERLTVEQNMEAFAKRVRPLL